MREMDNMIPKTEDQPEIQPTHASELIRNINSEVDQIQTQCGLLTIKEGQRWVKDALHRPVPQMLFDQFWYEGELAILFADTNLGKSILAVQIGDSLSKGIPIPGFKMDTPKKKVLYLDFELSDKQFQLRYTDDEGVHELGENFLRAELNAENIVSSKEFEDELFKSMSRAIENHGCEIIIIDNITYLGSENEKAKDALPLMKRLKSLKSKYNISILVLAHTPKRDSSKPLVGNDVQGSKMLLNFCDSCFAIGENPMESGMRYIKQLKARNCEIKYHTNNVIQCKIVKEESFLQFQFCDYGQELSFLLSNNATPSMEQKEALAREMKKNGATISEIMEATGLSKGKVSNCTTDITQKMGRNRRHDP